MERETRLPATIAITFVVGVAACGLIFGVPAPGATPGADAAGEIVPVVVVVPATGSADTLERYIIRSGGVAVRDTDAVDRRGAHPATKRMPKPFAQR
ncbi:hypothetical protein WJX64_01550 [Leifsonia sp. YIM 134122]|uniref:LytR/CpsA/Psr regulator C-terminal domain-containing protein n=1 Tax=Leifsonia stereocauli TaxID=3134136 RepID=A0ABU9VZN6_9MICO